MNKRPRMFLWAIGLALVSASGAHTATFKCQTGSCPNIASCDGSFYSKSDCTIQCYKECGTGDGEICEAGSADCGDP